MSAIKCFRCSSDQANGEFCKDPFNMDLISDQARRWTFVECADPPGRLDSHDHSLDTISVCIKYKQLSKPQCQYVFRVFYNFFVFFVVKGKEVVSRSCFWQKPNAPSNQCAIIDQSHPHIETLSCYSCSTDGCNGSVQYGPVALITVIVMVVAKCLT